MTGVRLWRWQISQSPSSESDMHLWTSRESTLGLSPSCDSYSLLTAVLWAVQKT